MNTGEITNICRICLDDSVVLDWNSPVYGYCDVTYRDCFYKYTQLNCSELETYSSMLCQICLNGLYNLHTFILKALESHKFFTERNPANLPLENSLNLEEDIKYTPTEFESIMVKTFEITPILPTDSEKPGVTESHKLVSTIEISQNEKRGSNRDHKTYNGSEHNVKQLSNKPIKKSRRKSKHKRIEKDELNDKLIPYNDVTAKNKETPNNESESIIKEPKARKKYKEIKKPRMCSICSKILHNKYAVELHEKTHMANRERNEICKVCGLKFYDKRNLYSHKRIHKENREKIHKCEFCDKAFYDKGGLNIHRRIHLGQMIPCSLCSKQFYRQIDLDRHMTSHSAATINSDAKKRSRYFVRCKHCDKSILSTSFKSHTAAHLNEPLMRCSICCKEFYRRASCVLHIKKVHQKTNEEYNNFIILYTKNRISHLFLEQKAEIQSTEK